MRLMADIELKRYGWYGVILLDLFSPVLPKKLYLWMIIRCYTIKIRP